MQAIVYDRYGPPDVLQLREVEDPLIGETEVLVRVRAASANPLDWFAFNGTPYVARAGFGLKKPDSARLGADLAGVVEAVGSGHRFPTGRRGVRGRTGSFAELATVGKTGAISAMPASLTFEQAAAVPVAGLTALQGLRDKGGIQPGQQVLINGASGGVGTRSPDRQDFRHRGDSGVQHWNVAAVRVLGADSVVDYTREDFTRGSERYDLMLDVAGSRSWSEAKRVLRPDATVVIVGGPKTNRWLGPLGHIIGMVWPHCRKPKTVSSSRRRTRQSRHPG